MKWVREYKIVVDQEILDELAETFGSGGLLDTITRMHDVGDHKDLFLYEADGDQMWTEEDPFMEDRKVFGPVAYEVTEVYAGPGR
jgi:hypothetical protein